ncbi:serine/threonine protein kinase [Nonomuraea sp. SYSU D8015]|uniref:serine/threonine protein kinase n=1 Tax=Nonomuraea sp. SYSU D8015 TaxID=2593644 RepID=UPI001660BA2C|nr:serine/threonine-protein kinase [Nonomuraea sp. SYSU D8015]
MAEVLALLAEDPRAIGPYRLEGRLGVGGQGTVYAGRGGDGGQVAVKLLHPHLMADHRGRQRFLREVETAKRVAPFCTAQVLDFGFDGSRPYIVSEFVDGPSLQTAVEDNGTRGAAALQRLAINTATALAAIHEAGVVHRDFKPGNVLLGPDGPVVIDFGIARALDLSQSVVSSQPIGSPAYMAPEQIAGGDVGPASDLFAWGATMVYAATGQRAFVGESIPGILHAILQGKPDLGGLEGPLRALLEECLAKDPAERPTAAQVIERLRALPSPAWQGVPIARPGCLAVPDAPGVPAASGAPTAPGAAVSAGPAVPAQKTGGRRRGLIMGTTSAAAMLATVVTGYFAFAPSASGNQAVGVITVVSLPVASPSTSVPETPAAHGTPTPEAIRQEAEAIPNTSVIPQGTPSQTRKPPRTKTPVEITTGTPDMKPTRKPTTKTAPPPSDEPAPPSLGTVTFDDAHDYCRALGQNMAGGSWDNLWCLGGAKITATTVCQWKYQGRNAVAEQPPNAFSPEATCRLS